MAQTALEIEIARIQKQRLDLQLQEDELLRKYKEEEFLKKKATDKVIARVIKILKEGDVSRSQLLTALDSDSVYGDGKGTAEVGVVVEVTDADVKVEAKKSRATIGADDKRLKVLPKYQNPFDLTEKWSGRGIPPSWAKKLKDANMLESARIPQSSDT
jgi:hypothetical protein